MKIGIIREGKNPPDKRVPLTPKQCLHLLQSYPNLKVEVQPSDIRVFKDSEYRHLGIPLSDDLSDCDVLMGVKEVPEEMLIPGKTYFFFSHTYKKQPYNRELLQAILDKQIRLVDYELLKNPHNGRRLVGFGKYAGIVGAYNAFRLYGQQSGDFSLKPAHECYDRKEMESQLSQIKLPANYKIILSGDGRVANGAMETLHKANINRITPDNFADYSDAEPGYVQLDVRHYFTREDGEPFTKHDFFRDHKGYRSNMMKWAREAQMYIAAHLWTKGSPLIFSREDAKKPEFAIKTISDISCDIDGPVASTLKPSTIEDPFYGYHPEKEEVVPLDTQGAIGVCAVDNLPCELPRDASEDFGGELIENVFPHLWSGDPEGIIKAATQTDNDGELTEKFQYLQDFVDGVEA